MYRTIYNESTTLVITNYPLGFTKGITIDENLETLTTFEGNTFPYLLITEEQFKDNLDKTMSVVDGVYQEYITPFADQLIAAQSAKIAEINAAKDAFEHAPLLHATHIHLMNHEEQGKFTTQHFAAPTADLYLILENGIRELILNAEVITLVAAINARHVSADIQAADYYATIHGIAGTQDLGAWNASTNSPALADGGGTLGDFYAVSVAGTQDLGSGSIVFAVDDQITYNGSIWVKALAADIDSITVNFT